MGKKILAIFIIAVCITTTFSFLSISLGSLVVQTPGFAVDILSNAPNGDPYSLENITSEIASDLGTVFLLYGPVTAGKLASGGGQLKRSSCRSTLEKGIYAVQAGLRLINGNYPDPNFDIVDGLNYFNSFYLYIDEGLQQVSSSGHVFIEFYSPATNFNYRIDPFPTYSSWIWKDTFYYRWTAVHNDQNPNVKTLVSNLMEEGFGIVKAGNNFNYAFPYLIGDWSYRRPNTYLKVYSDDFSTFEIIVNGSIISVNGEYIIAPSFDNTTIVLGINP